MARREALERWAEEQRRRSGPPSRRLRLQMGLARARRRLVQRLELASQAADRAVERFGDRLFDREVETAGTVYLHDYALDDRVLYRTSAWHLLPRTLRHTGFSKADTFVDFGCGKGRVVHQAARRPFRRVIGVEVSPELAEVARTALAAAAHRHRCRNVEIVAADVKDFEVPDDLTIAYFFRPFGEKTLDPLLRRIIESVDRHPRSVRLIYSWPTDEAHSMILATGRFRLVKELPTGIFDRRSGQVVIFESC
jgi:predicted RNA methylase